VRWASATSEELDATLAISQASHALRQGLAGGDPDLLLLFVSEHHFGDYELIGELVREALPRSLLLGCSARSVIGAGRELEEQPGISLVGAQLPGVTLQAFQLSSESLPDHTAGAAPWRELLGVTEPDAAQLVVLADPFSFDTESFVHGLDTALPGSVTIGGLASAGQEPGENALYAGEAVHRAGLTGVALSGNVVLDPIVAQGCRPIGTPLFVTRCRENRLLELDGRAPMEILQELYADTKDARERALFRSALFLGIEMRPALDGAYVQGDFLIRNLIDSDDEMGTVAVAATLHTGQVVQFHVRDAHASAEDLERQLARYVEQSDRRREGEPGGAAGALLFSCLGRGRELYGSTGFDSGTFRRIVGEVPLGGFFCDGEIGPIEGSTFLHGYTSAFGIFRPRD
jgi:small ligand-binding sensory domain FIST